MGAQAICIKLNNQLRIIDWKTFFLLTEMNFGGFWYEMQRNTRMMMMPASQHSEWLSSFQFVEFLSFFPLEYNFIRILERTLNGTCVWPWGALAVAGDYFNRILFVTPPKSHISNWIILNEITSVFIVHLAVLMLSLQSFSKPKWCKNFGNLRSLSVSQSHHSVRVSESVNVLIVGKDELFFGIFPCRYLEETNKQLSFLFRI